MYFKSKKDPNYDGLIDLKISGAARHVNSDLYVSIPFRVFYLTETATKRRLAPAWSEYSAVERQGCGEPWCLEGLEGDMRVNIDQEESDTDHSAVKTTAKLSIGFLTCSTDRSGPRGAVFQTWSCNFQLHGVSLITIIFFISYLDI